MPRLRVFLHLCHCAGELPLGLGREGSVDFRPEHPGVTGTVSKYWGHWALVLEGSRPCHDLRGPRELKTQGQRGRSPWSLSRPSPACLCAVPVYPALLTPEPGFTIALRAGDYPRVLLSRRRTAFVGTLVNPFF